MRVHIPHLISRASYPGRADSLVYGEQSQVSVGEDTSDDAADPSIFGRDQPSYPQVTRLYFALLTHQPTREISIPTTSTLT